MFFKKKKNEEFNYHVLDKDNIPQHIAFIMDGNGRWAKKRKMPRTYGHHEGTKTIRDVALHCNKLGVKAMTVYAFSTENFARPEQEVQYIFKLPKDFFELYMKELIENNVKICTIGHLEMAPKETQDIIYGGRDEILEATKKLAMKVKAGELGVNEINETVFNDELMTKDLPEVDLMIRTSGEQRLSNFLLWQLAYAEFIFTDVLWPDFNENELDKAIWMYQNRDRRFGGLK